MTADELALLRGVEAAPDDDLPRLVYADWLDEHGRHARAEFIRVQCELASIERRLLGMTWEERQDAELRRDELVATEREMLSTSRNKVARLHPIVRNRPCSQEQRDAEEHFERGFLAAFTAHNLSTRYMSVVLCCSKMVPRPRIIICNVKSVLTDETLQPSLIRQDIWSEIDELQMQDFMTSPPLLPHEFIPLMELEFPRVTAFASERMGLSPGHVCVIAERLKAPKLVHINLADNEIVDSGVAFLHRAIYAKTLRSIDLSRNPICRPEISKLTKDRFPSLVKVDLTGCPIMPQSLAQLRAQLPGVEVIC